MITKSEAAKLLALASAFDQRTIGETDIEAWFAAAHLCRWPFPAAKQVVVEYYASKAGRRRVTPADVTDRLRELRAKALAVFEYPKMPEELTNGAWPAWLRERLDEHVTAALDRWAATGEEPEPELPAPPSKTLPQLIATAPEEVRPQVIAASKRIGR